MQCGVTFAALSRSSPLTHVRPLPLIPTCSPRHLAVAIQRRTWLMAIVKSQSSQVIFLRSTETRLELLSMESREGNRPNSRMSKPLADEPRESLGGWATLISVEPRLSLTDLMWQRRDMQTHMKRGRRGGSEEEAEKDILFSV